MNAITEIQQDSAATSVPGLPMTTAKLKEWVRLAQRNARLTYGHGSVLAGACDAPVRALVGRLTEQGWVTPHFVRGRGEEPSRFIVQRSGREFLKGTVL